MTNGNGRTEKAQPVTLFSLLLTAAPSGRGRGYPLPSSARLWSLLRIAVIDCGLHEWNNA